MPTLDELWAGAYDPAVRREINYPGGTLVDAFDRFTQQFHDRPALDFFGARMNFTELKRAVTNVAGHLHELGVRPGDYVALLMPTCPQHVIAFYAVLACGATVVEHNPLYTADELGPLFGDHHARVAIVWDAAAPVLQALPEDVAPETIISINMISAMPLLKRLMLRLPIAKAKQSRAQLSRPAKGTISFEKLTGPGRPAPVDLRPAADDIALLLYTSGTTGTPKGVPLTHTNLLASTAQAMEWVTPLKPGRDVFLACLPLFHVFGCSLSMNAGLTDGAMLHLIPKPETGLILDAIKRCTPTMAIAVPPLFERIVDGAAERGVSLRGIRTGISGAMSLRGELIDKWEQATGGLLIEGYGLSECSPIVAGNPVNHDRKADSIGVPFPDTQVKLTDPEDPSREVPFGQPGEILVKGPQVFAGYRNLLTDESDAFVDGWFRTGDIAKPDEHGFLHIVDRIKEVVITGGFNVYPSEVEQAMRDHDGIDDIAVVGLANELGVEEVVAAVVTTDGLLPNVDELRHSVKERLAAYKVPRRFFVVTELPRNEMGKVLRREVRSRLEHNYFADQLAKFRPHWKIQLDEIGPELREWLNQAGDELQDRFEGSGQEMRERLETLDQNVRSWLGEESAILRERLETLDLPTRLGIWRDQLLGKDEHVTDTAEPDDDVARARGAS
ncbi:AMP-binding protein [Propionimicrobium sp. PCR01-08-3]|uniref:AMP-binding protein n=1 Tax=Propionimicrobium sp. PCR01-08-3 TaxID=3052086 RepID=UPI00255D068F|nr:AMP-binding protein [Propionimicrobium sp. PCR01-08-3]WIY82782.1 AMP-binding protein [Propionimicrobium sp. PCR01-08-3]